MKGLNKEYTETSRPHLILHTISPGNYSITVQCTQNDGNWSSEFTLLKFTVLPPWWQQSWFILICAVIIILSIIYAIRAHDQHLKRNTRNKNVPSIRKR
ncbi:triple tyrosine motif-containing protein [Phocaeicola dorei]|uniref:triple tyrosine motif-containing protein n=1 Tax=Phocaeicola dorei TaxID=357276 RepID=UPI0032E39DBA